MKRLLPVLMGFALLLGIQQAQAFDREDLKRLKETNECPKCNLQRANLTHLSGANLSGTDLRNADLLLAKLDPSGIRIAKATGAINISEPVVIAKKPSPTVTAKNSSSEDLKSRLLLIKRLESEGLITKEEAANKRQEILGSSSTLNRIKAELVPVFELFEIESILPSLIKNNVSPGIPIGAFEYGYFRHVERAQEWLYKKPNKTIAIGHPRECGYKYRAYNYSSVESAIRKSLTMCLSFVKKLSTHRKGKCGCKIVAINSNIFVHPEELSHRNLVPAVLVVQESAGLKEMHGFYEADGRIGGTFPLRFFNNNDREICSGTYTQYKTALKGLVEMQCFDNKKKIKGEFSITGFHQGQPFGTAVGKTNVGSMLN